MPTQWPGRVAVARELDPPSLESDAPPALEETMRRYAAMVFRVCYAVTRNVHDAEDATQAAFLALHVQTKTGRPIRNVGGWLGQVGQRMALDLVRSKKRRLKRESAQLTVPRLYVENADQAESKAIIAQELDKLPAKYRLPLILHYFGGMSHQEMSREMSCKPGTLRVRLCRAKEMLGQRLSSRGIDLLGSALDLALEQIIHGGVTQSIVSAAKSATETIAHGSSGNPPLPPGVEIWRSAGLTAKTKALVGASLLIATTVAAAMAQALGSVGASLTRHLPAELDAAIHAMTRPVLKSILPSFQARATQPSEDKTLPTDGLHLAAASPDQTDNAPVKQYPIAPTDDLAFNGSPTFGLPHPSELSFALAQIPPLRMTQAAPANQDDLLAPPSGSGDFRIGANLPDFASADSDSAASLAAAKRLISAQKTSLTALALNDLSKESNGVTTDVAIGPAWSGSGAQAYSNPSPSFTDDVVPTTTIVPEPVGLAIIAGGFLLLRRRRA